jgi:hypothetical protein
MIIELTADYVDRNLLVQGLANSGYKVWVVDKTLDTFPIKKKISVLRFEISEDCMVQEQEGK